MEKKIVVKSTVGLHASLAAKVVQAASKYSVDITLHYHDKVVDVKSILGLMSLAVPQGENVIVVAPPLIITEEQLSEELEKLDQVLSIVDEKYI
jgi:phosphocarrier protein